MCQPAIVGPAGIEHRTHAQLLHHRDERQFHFGLKAWEQNVDTAGGALLPCGLALVVADAAEELVETAVLIGKQHFHAATIRVGHGQHRIAFSLAIAEEMLLVHQRQLD